MRYYGGETGTDVRTIIRTGPHKTCRLRASGGLIPTRRRCTRRARLVTPADRRCCLGMGDDFCGDLQTYGSADRKRQTGDALGSSAYRGVRSRSVWAVLEAAVSFPLMFVARCGTVAVPLQRRCGRRCRAVGKTQNGVHEYFFGLDARSVVASLSLRCRFEFNLDNFSVRCSLDALDA